MSDSRDARPAQHWLISISGEAEATTATGQSKTRIKGELVLEPLGDPGGLRGVRVVRFAVAAGGVKGRHGPTGTMSITGESAIGSVGAAERLPSVDLHIPGRINYPSLDRARVKSIDRGCAYVPAFEPCAIQLTLTFDQRRGRAEGRIVMVSAAGEFEEFISLTATLRGADLRAIANVDADAHFAANTPYDPCIATNRRSLPCRPVVFKNSAGDANPTGSSLPAQFAMAQTIWGRACIDFDILPTITIIDATLKTSSNLTAIRAARDDLNEIEVFAVADPLTGTGGGNAGAIGQASCQVVIAEPNNGNTVLLAHELGHVINLLHPNGTGSHSETVMQPTGSAMNQGKTAIIFPMIAYIANPLMTTTATSCCLSPDKADHFIRDFPADQGQEPSDPLPSGMTRYSMSNVWNRTTNTPGGWNAATGPDHQSPYHYQADGVTPALNYLFARVEQRNNLPVGAANVKFYLKTPGSGGGANLTLLGSGNVASGLVLGNSRDASLTWTVPSGVPAHSCCFAVVSSPEEPEGDPTQLAWAAFEDMCHQDNDWAQRNLDIIETGNMGAGNVWESAPWLVQLPRAAAQERLPLTLTVQASGAGLREVEIEMPGVATYKVKPGELSKFNVKAPVMAGEDRPLIIRVALTRAPKRGSSVSVLVDPTLGKQPLAGFATMFRAAGTRAALRMFLDRAIAAAVSVADAVDDDAWHQLAFDLRGFAGGRCPHFPALARGIGGLASLKACVGSAGRWPLAQSYGLDAVGQRLAEAQSSENAGELNALLWSFLVRAQMASPGALAAAG